jgi:excisionase family DNA binding protein
MKTDPHFVPTLDALAMEPALAAELETEDVEALLGRSMVAQSALVQRLLALPRRGRGGDPREDDEPDLHQLDAGHVAAVLGVPKDFVYDLIRRGVLPSIKVGKYVRIPADRLRDWIKGREEEARLLHGDPGWEVRGGARARSLRARRNADSP